MGTPRRAHRLPAHSRSPLRRSRSRPATNKYLAFEGQRDGALPDIPSRRPCASPRDTASANLSQSRWAETTSQSCLRPTTRPCAPTSSLDGRPNDADRESKKPRCELLEESSVDG